MKELIKKIESLKFPQAKPGSHMESGNSMLAVAVALIRQHEARTPQAQEVDEEEGANILGDAWHEAVMHKNSPRYAAFRALRVRYTITKRKAR